MALWDSSDIVARAKRRLNRPSTDEAFTESTTDDIWYAFATEAQDRVNRLLGIYVPDATWTVPTQLTTSDSGETYGFGNDVDSEAIFAFGHFKLFENEESIPDYPLVPGVDFTVEGTGGADRGTVIRIPANTTRSFVGGGPWARYVAPSNVITSSTQPTIPKFARKPMVSDMVRLGMERLYGAGAGGDADVQFLSEWMEVLAAIRTQASSKHGKVLRYRSRRFLRNAT